MDTIMVKWVLLGKIKVKSIFFYILLANLGQWNTSAADTALHTHGRLQTEINFNVLCIWCCLYLGVPPLHSRRGRAKLHPAVPRRWVGWCEDVSNFAQRRPVQGLSTTSSTSPATGGSTWTAPPSPASTASMTTRTRPVSRQAGDIVRCRIMR